MNRLDDVHAYPIREFARLTNVNPVTLRAWERRYGIIRPERTEKGHRFYTEQHIQQVRNILYWLDQGYPIRQVKSLLKDSTPQGMQEEDSEWTERRARLLNAATQLSLHQLDKLWTDGFSSYPAAVYFDFCLIPVIRSLRADSSHPAIVKGFEYALKQKLSSLLHMQQLACSGDSVLCCCTHPLAELSTLAAACALGGAEYQVDYFGPELTSADVSYLSESGRWQALWLQFHPLTEDIREQHWTEQLQTNGLALYCSDLSDNSDIHSGQIKAMKGSLSQQIRQFIQCQKQGDMQ